MNIKLITLLDSKMVLEKMGNSKEYDGVTNYKIARNISVVNPELTNFEKAQNELIEKYGAKLKDKDGNETKEMKVTSVNMDIFAKEVTEILETEFDLDILLINPEKITGLSPFEMMAIDWMLKLE